MNKAPATSTSFTGAPNGDYEVRSLDSDGATAAVKPTARFNVLYMLAGILFGVVLVKSEVVSWFRIQEMFRFQSFHMYGVIGSAVAVALVSVIVIRKFNINTVHGEPITFPRRVFHKGNVYGGLLFGFGWALTGACPGPLFAQIGTGVTVTVVTLLSAVAGTWVYGRFRHRLPH